MSNTKDRIVQEVKLFFRNISWKNCLTFLVFLFLAVFFWMMQIYREKFESTYSIPIKYTQVPDSILFEDELPTRINANIRDDGATLFRYALTKKNDSININIRELIKSKKGSDKLNIQGEGLILLIKEKLFGSTELISYSPSFISSSYAVMNQKTVPVIFEGKVEPKQGYIIDGDITIEPERISVYASKQALDTILFIRTVSDTIRGLQESVSIPIPIKKKRGMKYNPDSVTINVPIDQFNIKDLNVPITCTNLPKGLSVKFFPSTVKVMFTVGLKKYKDATEDQFGINIDYNDIANQKASSISVQLTNKPDFVIVQSIEPSLVEFIIEKE